MGTLVVPVDAKLESIKVDGQAISLDRPAGPPGAKWRLFNHYTLPPQGSEIEVVLGATQPMDWYVYDRSSGLPPAGQALIAARPRDAAAIQDGDVTMVSRKVRI